MNTLFFIGLFATAIFGAVQAVDSDVTRFLKHLEVIPDVITKGPPDFLKVSFDSGVFADKGVELTPTQVKNQPTVEWKVQKKSFYTLMMVDPDAPSREAPTSREFLHWLVVNVPGKHVNKGQVLAEYVGSGPPKDTGLHRYVFLVYKQPRKLQFDEKPISKNSAEGRPSFSTKKFTEKYKLEDIVAANFYQAQYDDYVPVVHKQLNL